MRCQTISCMKKILSIVVFSLLVISSYGQDKSKALNINVIPQPVAASGGNGKLVLTDIAIAAQSADEVNVANMLQEFFKANAIRSVVSGTSSANIKLVTKNDPSLGNEGYKLSVTPKDVTITANSGAGLFYGVQSLFQIISVGKKIELPVLEVSDQPRFSWRGLHLDVGRHFFPVSFIKKYIDVMAHYKYNTFHWHLTEDQGWRIEIKKYPKLQEIAANRKETVIGHASTKTRDEVKKYDGIPHGGYYTQEEVKEVVAYAAQRYVTIVPEIEMPGHAQAALAAYPNLGCTGGPYEVVTTWGVFKEVFCAGKETTFEFLEDVLDEVIPLFPGKYVHVGGDECPKDRWKTCPNCQQRMKTENLKDEHELQSYFIQRMEKYINSKGKTVIGWDEILEGGLAPNAAVMSWRGEEGGIAAAQQNHDVVMTPGKWCYFDHYQAPAEKEPLAIGGFLPVSLVYSYEPVPPSLNKEQAKHVLGSQGNVWTEYMATSDYVEYMVYPRAIALSEVLWSPKESRNYDNFVERLKVNQKLLDLWKINYAKHVFAADKAEVKK
jgi:hexosaminidase